MTTLFNRSKTALWSGRIISILVMLFFLHQFIARSLADQTSYFEIKAMRNIKLQIQITLDGFVGQRDVELDREMWDWDVELIKMCQQAYSYLFGHQWRNLPLSMADLHIS